MANYCNLTLVDSKKYNEDEIEVLDSFINHTRDDSFTYVAMEQFRGKYLVQDRATKTIYERSLLCLPPTLLF